MDNEIIKKIVSYAMLLSVFITGGVMNIGLTVEWYYLLYISFAVLGILVYQQFSLRLGIFLAALTLYSLITCQYPQTLVWKQLINIAFSVFVFYNFLLWEKWNVESVFHKYVALAKIVLVIGFVQVIAFVAEPYDGGFSRGWYTKIFPFLAESNLSVRFQSVTDEPALIASVFAPVVMLSLYNLTHRFGYLINRWWSAFFIVGYMLTFSVVAYTGIFAVLLLLYFRNFSLRKLSLVLAMVCFMAALAATLYSTVKEVRLRTDDTIFGFTSDITDPLVYKELNLTSYAILSNGFVTKQSLKKYPMTGTGIGTYQLNFADNLPDDMKLYSQLNRQDGGSLGLRLLAETGIIGLGCFLYFLLRFRLKAQSWFTEEQEFLWIINAGIFVMTILFLIRSGNYTYQARVLFFMMYYLTYRAVSRQSATTEISLIS